MNERIKELAERAGFVLWGDESWNPGEVIDWSSRYDDELEKFAELIVRECADIAYDTQYNHGRASYETDSCARAIRQHFGVGVIHLPSAVTTVPTMTSMPTIKGEE